jgi:hypothetical protein
MALPEEELEPFARQRAVLLTTFRRDGTPVATPVSIAVDGGRAFIRTYNRAGKAKRSSQQRQRRDRSLNDARQADRPFNLCADEAA